MNIRKPVYFSAIAQARDAEAIGMLRIAVADCPLGKACVQVFEANPEHPIEPDSSVCRWMASANEQRVVCSFRKAG